MAHKIPRKFLRIKELPVKHVWRGHGSSLFLEFGQLNSTIKQDGSVGPPEGEMSLMIEWSWRIEREKTILCGSFSDEQTQSEILPLLLGCNVVECSVFGSVPEISVGLSNSVRILSFMTAEGDPAWTLFNRREGQTEWLHVRDGNLRVESP